MKITPLFTAGFCVALLAGCSDDGSDKNTEDQFITYCVPIVDENGNLTTKTIKDPFSSDGSTIEIHEECRIVENPDYGKSSYSPPFISTASTPTQVTLDPSTGQ